MGAGVAAVLALLSAAHVGLNRGGHIRAPGAARGELTVGHLPVT